MRGVFWVLALALAGCGYVGDPQPPSLDIPVPVSDLRAFEYGDKIVVGFTLPELTTEGLPLKNVTAVELLAGERSLSLPVDKPGPVDYEFPVGDLAGQTIDIKVRATGPKGKQSAWSNVWSLTVIPPLETPTNIRADNVERGVTLRWQGAGPKYRIHRSTEGAPPQPIADSESSEYVDETTIYGIHYEYRVQALANDAQQGALTEPISITPEDKFPPAVPAGVMGLAAGQSIELAWERNTEDDFASYNVYRSVDAAPFQRVSTALESPTYSDSQVEAGKRYRYTVTAIDMRGNESAQSSPIEVMMP